MIFKAENNTFTLAVKEMGAELNSLKSKKSGFEFIWDGNEEYWYGQSPILFPIIGRLLDDKYRLNGTEYTMPKHGIVRKKPFTLIESTTDSLTFVQTDDEESIAMYPYKFELKVKFTLTETGLVVDHTVINKSDETMYYSFGAHPAFNCEIGDYLEFNKDTVLTTERIDHDSMDGNKVVITKDIFVDDALILSNYSSDVVTLKSNNHGREVKFNFKSPLLGIWAKPGAPYVCIEPWWGVNDNYDKKDDLSQKRGIMEIEAGKSETFSWSIEITE